MQTSAAACVIEAVQQLQLLTRPSNSFAIVEPASMQRTANHMMML
jgi:hypothetical protein